MNTWGLNKEQQEVWAEACKRNILIEKYADGRFSAEQMKVITYVVAKGLNINAFTNSEIPAEEMVAILEKMMKDITAYEVEDLECFREDFGYNVKDFNVVWNPATEEYEAITEEGWDYIKNFNQAVFIVNKYNNGEHIEANSEDIIHMAEIAETMEAEGCSNGAIARELDKYTEHHRGEAIKMVDEMKKERQIEERMNAFKAQGFNKDQLDELEDGLKKGLNVGKYADKRFNDCQMCQIKEGLEAGVNVDYYTNPDFDIFQMYEIKEGLKAGIDPSEYTDPAYCWEYMEEIRERLERYKSRLKGRGVNKMEIRNRMVELLKTYREDLTKQYKNNELWDYLIEEEFCDYEFTVSLTSNGIEYKNACITLACGGPTVYLNTKHGELVCVWGDIEEKLRLDDDVIKEIDACLEELYAMY